MKTLIIATAMFAAAVPAMAQTSVSINIGQPGFYGRIELGGYAPPPVYYTQPVIVERQVRYVGQPVYLRVPEGHRKHWNKHCRRYSACGQQVFFVQDGWYNNTYAPRYRDDHRGDDRGRNGGGGDDDHGKGKDKDKGHGNGKGHGKSHDKHEN